MWQCPAGGCEHTAASKHGVRMHYINKPDDEHPGDKVDDVPEPERMGQGSTGDGDDTDDTPDTTPETAGGAESGGDSGDTGGDDSKAADPPFDTTAPDSGSTGGSGSREQSNGDGGATTADSYDIPEGFMIELDEDEHAGHPTGWIEAEGTEQYSPGDGIVTDDGTVWHVEAVYEPGDL